MQIGRSVGESHKGFIKRHFPVFLGMASTVSGQSREELYQYAAQIAAKMHPDDLGEIRGVAEGSGLKYEDALFLNLFYELSGQRLACRQLAAWGAAAEGGELLHARNLDWFDYPGGPLKRHNLILNVEPEGGIEYLLLTWPGFQGALTGVNRQGIAIAFNELMTRERPEYVGEPAFFAMKRVLRTCSTLEEALALLRRARPMGSGSIMVSDAKARRAVVVEIHNGQFGVREADGEMIGNANHATAEAGLKGVSAMPASWPTCEVAEELGLPLTVEKAKRVMAERRVLQQSNLLSVVFVPERNAMHLSCGMRRAAAGRFEEHQLFEGGGWWDE